MKLPGFLEEDDGSKSSTRLVFVAWSLIVALAWAAICVMKRELVPIEGSVIAVMMGLSGLKLAQRVVEEKAIDNANGGPDREVLAKQNAVIAETLGSIADRLPTKKGVIP